MKLSSFYFLLFSLWLTDVECNYEFEKDQVGILKDLINQTLESLRPNLVELHIKNENFETGPQEFGNLNGNFSEVIVEGLEKFNVKVINTTLLDINNLTVEVQNVSVKGFYRMNGTLAFPLGKNDIRLFGDGDFGARFTKFSVSVKMKIRFENGIKILKDFDIFVGLDKIQVYFKNLMGGGDLEIVFNQLFNEVGLTVFNYYKDPVVSMVKSQLAEIITALLNENSVNKGSRVEL